MEPSREIRDLLLGFYRDMSVGDPSVAEMFSAATGVVSIGSAPAEWVVGGPETKAVLSDAAVKQQGILITAGSLHAFVEGSVGWIADDPTFRTDDGSVVPARATVVFHREASEWKCVQMHFSIGVPNEEAVGRELTDVEAVLEAVSQERPDLKPVASREGTLTIMFTDIEASTAANEALGDDRFLPLLMKHHDILRTRTADHGGTVVKSQGDGFMLAFPSARRAVECAIEMQRDVAELDVIKVRMGLHTGEPVRHEDDFYGRDVAYAARVGAVAVGGEILISSLVKSLIEPAGSFRIDGPREHDLKGFDGPQPVYAVGW